jgi:hypothetical protein
MGFFKFENFDNTFEWSLDISNGGYINIVDLDFEHLQEDDSKLNTIGLLFNSSNSFQEAYINKKYYTPNYYKFKDVYGKDVLYDTLRIVYYYQGNMTDTRKPENFYFSFGINRDGNNIREWFLPLDPSCGYTHIDLDLEPLHEQTDSFDEVFFKVLNHPGNAKLYLGSMFLLQSTDELHNIKLALSDMLHLKYKKPLTTLSNNISFGDMDFPIVGTSDVYKGTTVMLGNDQVSEVHVVKQVDLTSENTAILKFLDEFDMKEVMYTWSAGTTVYKVFPASITEMRDADAIFPLFFIYSEAFNNDENSLNLSDVIRDNYVRDQIGNHTVAVRRSWDTVTAQVTINVFSDTIETALDMWRFLKSKVTTRDILVVAGKPIQYIVSGERDISPEDSESLPNYIMDLTFYYRNNVYDRQYVKYPKYTSMAVTYEITPVEVIK